MGTKRPNAIIELYRTKTNDGSVLATYTVNHTRTATENHTHYSHNIQSYTKK